MFLEVTRLREDYFGNITGKPEKVIINTDHIVEVVHDGLVMYNDDYIPTKESYDTLVNKLRQIKGSWLI